MSLLFKALTNHTADELKTEDGYDKHLHCEGSREHVLSYDTNGVHCSEPNCVVNRDRQSNIEDWIFLDEENEGDKEYDWQRNRFFNL